MTPPVVRQQRSAANGAGGILAAKLFWAASEHRELLERAAANFIQPDQRVTGATDEASTALIYGHRTIWRVDIPHGATRADPAPVFRQLPGWSGVGMADHTEDVVVRRNIGGIGGTS